jgi:hypothetical protein
LLNTLGETSWHCSATSLSVLTPSFGGKFYKLKKLCPLLTDFSMEDFKEKALDQAIHKHFCWFYYKDAPLS